MLPILEENNHLSQSVYSNRPAMLLNTIFIIAIIIIIIVMMMLMIMMMIISIITAVIIIGCHMQDVVLRATCYEGTAQLLSLTESKSHVFKLYFIGRTINR